MTEMTDHANEEQLSALMDGELSTVDLRFAVNQLAFDEDRQQLWQRYHAIGAAMRDEPTVKANFAANVMAAIADVEQEAAEPLLVAGADEAEPSATAKPELPEPTEKKKRGLALPAWLGGGWQRPALGLGFVTAAVAAVVWTVFPEMLGQQDEIASAPRAQQPVRVATALPQAPASQRTATGAESMTAAALDNAPIAEWRLASPEVQHRLNTYLINHAEYASRGAGRDMMQYVRFVGYQDEAN